MKTEVTVREAHVEDADLLRTLLCRAFAEYEGQMDPPSGVSSETSASVAHRIQRGGALVCETGTAAVGCAFYEPGAGFLYVGRFGVNPEYRGAGIGALLLEAAERRAPDYGFTRVRLNVRIALERLAAYYEARGYVPIAYHAHAGYASPTYVEMEKDLIVIRKSAEADFASVLAIVNDAARAYRGVIPADRWHEPYMPAEELAREIVEGIVFWVAEHDGRPAGVMGIQDKGDVALVRHAYVATAAQRAGVGTRLLRHVESLVDKPVLIGTWAAASWAIDFYRRNGFTVVSSENKDRLLRTYWSIPARQIETSVVLANKRWMEIQAPHAT